MKVAMVALAAGKEAFSDYRHVYKAKALLQHAFPKWWPIHATMHHRGGLANQLLADFKLASSCSIPLDGPCRSRDGAQGSIGRHGVGPLPGPTACGFHGLISPRRCSRDTPSRSAGELVAAPGCEDKIRPPDPHPLPLGKLLQETPHPQLGRRPGADSVKRQGERSAARDRLLLGHRPHERQHTCRRTSCSAFHLCAGRPSSRRPGFPIRG